MARKKKLSPNQQLYAEQEKRIKKFIKSAKKRGFEFIDFKLPVKPKRITKKKIRELEALTPDVLYSKASYTSKETGDTITGTQRRTQERQAASAKGRRTRAKKTRKGQAPKRTRQIMQTLLEMAEEYEAMFATNKRWVNGGVDITHIALNLMQFIKNRYVLLGEERFGEICERHPELIELAQVAFYDSSQGRAEYSFNAFVRIVMGEAMTPELQELFGTDSDYND